MPMTQADLDTVIDAVETAMTTFKASNAALVADMTAAFDRLLAKIATLGTPPPIDLTNEVNRINAITDALATLNAADNDADAQAKVEGN